MPPPTPHTTAAATFLRRAGNVPCVMQAAATSNAAAIADIATAADVARIGHRICRRRPLRSRPPITVPLHPQARIRSAAARHSVSCGSAADTTAAVPERVPVPAPATDLGSAAARPSTVHLF